MSRRRPHVSATFVVDRREGDVVVVLDEQGAAIDVPASELPTPARAEGAVLRVPLVNGEPRWSEAKRDRVEEKRRRADLATRIARLRRADPGGDIEL